MTQPDSSARSPMLQRLYDERERNVAFMDHIVDSANNEGRDLTESEAQSLARTRERVEQLDPQIRQLEEFEDLRAAGNAAARDYAPRPDTADVPGRTRLSARVETRAHNYRTRGECIVDQLRAAPMNLGGQSDPDARERLLSAGVIFAGVADADIAVARANAREAANRIAQDSSEIRATQVTGDTPGVLPVPIIGEVMSDVDAARPFINSLGAKSLAFAGETFKRPVITQHSAVAKQATQAVAPVGGSQKLIIGSVTFTKETWGGYLDVSRQDIDWTSPAAWDAILNDLQEQYALQTENAAADAFAAAVVATFENPGPMAAPGPTLANYITALYGAAALAYAGGGRLPDKIWASLDMWSSLGPLIEAQVSTNQTPGNTSVGSFVGELLKLPRIVVPSFPNGTLIIGVSRWTEVYEERIGLLTAVLPSVFGVQVAYGGYVAYNTLKAGAFAKVVNLAA